MNKPYKQYRITYKKNDKERSFLYRCGSRMNRQLCAIVILMTDLRNSSRPEGISQAENELETDDITTFNDVTASDMSWEFIKYVDQKEFLLKYKQ